MASTWNKISIDGPLKIVLGWSYQAVLQVDLGEWCQSPFWSTDSRLHLWTAQCWTEHIDSGEVTSSDTQAQQHSSSSIDDVWSSWLWVSPSCFPFSVWLRTPHSSTMGF